MTKWGTLIYSICPVNNDKRVFVGPTIEAPSRQLAHEYCQNNGMGYCHIGDELIMEIPCKEGTYEPDWNKSVDYHKEQYN